MLNSYKPFQDKSTCSYFYFHKLLIESSVRAEVKLVEMFIEFIINISSIPNGKGK
jgi:hypothetical protein